ncbi:MAG: DEAD/DEAH box helicase [Planctomycetes bacterium]|nr:DEAD/DEAH box helicase [Planctomycetota bacterium]
MDRDEVCSRFLEAVAYDLYAYQEEALLAWFETDDGVLVTAPTGMGKTLLAEAALFEALHTGTHLYYTTPLIALTDQKFREMQDRAEDWGFSREDVGLITGNRRENPDAPVLVVVAEILLNHLLGHDHRVGTTSAVVMDEFHFFNDYDRGVVWELSLVLLPKHVRLLLLSATVGNAPEFVRWLRKEHGRELELVQGTERRVPLDYVWIGDTLLAEHLPAMVSREDGQNRTPALVFCFNRDECWEVAERLKGLPLITPETRKKIEASLPAADFADGAGPKLKQMLIRGVGVHHAGILPKYKQVVEELFVRKLVPFVICTETLAAGVNLPARSVVLTTLMKGKPREKKLVLPSSAHQMFGRAGRPQFDDRGYVHVMAHEDDIRIAKWRIKYEKIDPHSKDPGVMRARKNLERKRPSRRRTQQYWTEGQFRDLIKANPGKLFARSMIPYQVLVFLITRNGLLSDATDFLAKRFNSPDRIEGFLKQFGFMIDNLTALGYLTKSEDREHITLSDEIGRLLTFRSIDPLYGAFLADTLTTANLQERIMALESVLPLPPAIARRVPPPETLEPGPLETNLLMPQMIPSSLASRRV